MIMQIKSLQKSFYKTFLILTFLQFLFCFSLHAAYLEYVPQTLIQPSGDTIHCFASGDEFYHWLHDKDGYTIVLNPATNFWVYATKSGDTLAPTVNIVGQTDPSTIQLSKWLKISPEKIKQRVKNYRFDIKKPKSKDNVDQTQIVHSGTINNIVIFIRFSTESEFTQQISVYDNMFNATGSASMKGYFLEASYNSLTISSTFYPTPGATVISYQDSHVRNYYRPYNSVSNPIGYQTENERTNREHTLLKNAVDAVSSQIPSGLNVDTDGDTYVDNVCFVIYGNADGWSDLLWSHRWALYSQTTYINSKRVWDYNFMMQNQTDAGVLSHEMFHSLGAPDLYHYSQNGYHPVGSWDLMEYQGNPPHHMGAYMKYKYGNWISSIPQITTAGTYSLNPVTSSSGNCYRINSPNSTTEYFMVEYRRKTGTYETSIPGTGLLVYRIKTDCGDGNADGSPDEVYIYRPNGTTTVDGTVNSANYSSDVGRIQINDGTNPSCFLSSGSAGGINIYDIGTAGTTISFKVGMGVTAPQLISPTNNSDALTTTPQFKWYKNTSAPISYIQVSTASNFSSFVINTLVSNNDTIYQVSSPLSNGTLYYWRVRYYTTGGDSSDWSSTWNLRTVLAAPTLISPANNSTAVDTFPTFNWNSVTGADTYTLQISIVSDFANILYNVTNLTGTSYTKNGLSYSKKYYWRVNASNSGGSSNWSSVWNFTTKLAVPTLMSPLNNAKNISDSSVVIWHLVDFATRYRVQISKFSNFSVNVFDQSNWTDTTFAYTGLEYATLYYWHVNSGNSEGTSSWSNTWQFTTTLASPVLVYPANQALSIPDSGYCSWNIVASAQSYQLQISTSSQFLSTIVNVSGITSLNFTYTGLNYNTLYYWRVRAQNNDGDGKWSDVSEFTTWLSAPTLLNPQNQAVGQPIAGILNWSSVTDASGYKLMIATNQIFSPTIVNDSNILVNSYNYSGLQKNQIYYWKVSGKNINNSGKWSSIWNFTTSFDAPTLIYPAQNSYAIPLSGTFTWNAVSGANSYKIIVSINSNFSSPIINDSNIIGTSYAFNGLANNQKYYWKVRGVSSNNMGDWSAIWNFTTILNSAILASPSNNSLGIPVIGNFVWNTIPGASSYKLEVSTNSGFSTFVINDTNVTGTTFTYSGLDKNQKYYWKVSGKNANNFGDWSTIWNFTTTFDAPVLINPPNNSSGVHAPIILSWNMVNIANMYQLIISLNPDLSSPIINDSNISGTVYFFTSFEVNKTYYWKVRGRKDNNPGNWSERWSFTTNVGVLSLQFPSNLSTDIPVNGEFRWAEFDGAESYKLIVDDNSNFSSPIINDSSLTNNVFQYNNLQKNKIYYWKVCAKVNSNYSDWSETWSFTTTGDLPILRFPLDNAQNISVDFTFLWEPYNGATGYNFQLSYFNDFSTIFVNDSAININTFTVNNLTNNSLFFWRVRAKLGTVWSGWSDVWEFSTTLATPLLISPSNQAVWENINGQLKWQAVEGATYYVLQISISSAFDSFIYNDSSLTECLFDYNNLNFNQTYHWRVAANNNNSKSNWSEQWNFKTRIQVPLLISPINLSEHQDPGKGTFIWQPVEGASTYNLQLSKTNDFSAFSQDFNDLTDSRYNYSNLDLLIDYYWHVNAQTQDGTTDWSDTWTFKTESFVGINDISGNDYSIKIIPNPVTDGGNIMINLYEDKYLNIVLRNNLGQKIKELFNGSLEKGQHSILLTNENLSSGQYFIEVFSEKKFDRIMFFNYK